MKILAQNLFKSRVYIKFQRVLHSNHTEKSSIVRMFGLSRRNL